MGSISEPVLLEIEKTGNEVKLLRHMLNTRVSTYTSTNNAEDNGNAADSNLAISKLLGPILKKMDFSEKQLKEIKEILKKQSKLVPGIKKVDKEELNIIERNYNNMKIQNNHMAVTIAEQEKFIKVLSCITVVLGSIFLCRGLFG